MRCVNGSAINCLITLNHLTNASQGIYAGNSNSNIFKNILDNIRTRGISIYNSNCLIKGNYFSLVNNDRPDGIFIQADNASYRPFIDSNYIKTNGDGIYKNPGTRLTIRSNEIILYNGDEGILRF